MPCGIRRTQSTQPSRCKDMKTVTKRTIAWLGVISLFVVANDSAQAQDIEAAQHRPILRRPPPDCPPFPALEVRPLDPKDRPLDPKDRPMVDDPTMPGLFAEAPRGGGAAAAQYNPAMFGDIIGGPRITTLVNVNGSTVLAQVPAFVRGGFRIPDCEGARPTDRVYFIYNHYDRVDVSQPALNFDINRETIGFEKTFFNDNASIGLRYPFIQLSGNHGDLDSSPDGDLSVILKWAFLNNRDT